MKQFLTGARGIEEALKQGKGVLHVSRKGGRAMDLANMAEQHAVRVSVVTRQGMTTLIGHEGHRGYALEVATDNQSGSRTTDLKTVLDNASEQSLLVALDGITDPGNLGAVLRSADQFSASAVLVPGRRSAGPEADSLSRASAGAVEWVPVIQVGNLVRSLNMLKDNNFWIWGADPGGERTDSVSLKGRIVLVLGREGQGLHRLVREQCDGLVSIPTRGAVNSLNVSVAAGILMYEKRRQDSVSAGT